MKPPRTAFWNLILAALVGGALVACPKAKKPSTEAESPEMEAPITSTDTVSGMESGMSGGPAADIGTEWAALPGVLEAVYFDYMGANLNDAARASLKKNAATLKLILKTAPTARVRVEGHADERGTLEYNLALGERRASAVRDYYASLGIARSVLSTISYGEERPACTEASESCYGQNRRGETTLRASAAVSVPLGK